MRYKDLTESANVQKGKSFGSFKCTLAIDNSLYRFTNGEIQVTFDAGSSVRDVPSYYDIEVETVSTATPVYKDILDIADDVDTSITMSIPKIDQFYKQYKRDIDRVMSNRDAYASLLDMYDGADIFTKAVETFKDSMEKFFDAPR